MENPKRVRRIHRLLPWVAATVTVFSACTESVDIKTLSLDRASEAIVVDTKSAVNRRDASALSREWGRAVGLMIRNDYVTDHPTELGVKNISSQANELCTDELFAGETASRGHCTAFYIGAEMFLTAGHCIAPEDAPSDLDNKKCSHVSVIVDWAWPEGDIPSVITANNNQVYQCASIVAHGGRLPEISDGNPLVQCSSKNQYPNCSNEPIQFDWAVFKVDRTVDAAVVGAPFAIEVPVPFATATGVDLVGIGHPHGLAQKVDELGQIATFDFDEYPPLGVYQNWFRFNIDAMKGSSGSPLIDAATGGVIGIDVETPSYSYPAVEEWDPLVTENGTTCRKHTQCGGPAYPNGIYCNGSGAVTAWNAFVPVKPVNLNDQTAVEWQTGMSLSIPGDWNQDLTRDGLIFTKTASGWELRFRQGALSSGILAKFPTASAYRIGDVSTYGNEAEFLVGAGFFDGDTDLDFLLLINRTPYLVNASTAAEYIASPDENRVLTPASLSFLTGLSASNLIVDDYNADLKNDVRVILTSGDELTFCGSTSGLTENCGVEGARADANGDGLPDLVRLTQSGTGSTAVVHWNTYLSPLNTGFSANLSAPFDNPHSVVVGNFNGDRIADSITGIVTSWDDIAFISDDRPYWMRAAGIGGYSGGTLGIDPSNVTAPGRKFTALRVNDLNTDGNDDLEAVREDGSVTVFFGSSYNASQNNHDTGGLTYPGTEFTGLPTADGADGKMLTISGLGMKTIDRPSTSMTISVPSGAAEFEVQVFDGDLGGLFDDVQSDGAHTCFQLVAEPLKDDLGTQVVAQMTDADLADNGWTTLYVDQTLSSTSSSRAPSGNYFYRLDVFLAADCNSPVDETMQAVNTFKVRTTGLVSIAHRDYSVMAHDAVGPYARHYKTWLVPNTEYDGTFDFYTDVPSTVSALAVAESDADDLLDDVPGRGTGANEEIFYAVYAPDHIYDMSVAAAYNDNPSGNYDLGLGETDAELFSPITAGTVDGIWRWHWGEVNSINNIHMWTPCPADILDANLETFGLPRVGLPVTGAGSAAYWAEQAAYLAALLPLDLGGDDSSSAAPRTAAMTIGLPAAPAASSFHMVETVEDALAILDGIDGTATERLAAQLLTARLNVEAGLSVGENLTEGYVQGTHERIGDVITSAAQSLFSGAPDESLTALLAAINQKEVTYRIPERGFPENPDGDADDDGVPNIMDNCPESYNPDQADSSGNGTGDVCECAALRAPRPVANNLRLSYRNPNPAAVTDGNVHTFFEISNVGDVDVDLEDISVRYWFTDDVTEELSFTVDWATVGASNITGQFEHPSIARDGGDTYLSFGFKEQAGVLSAGASTGEIQARFNAEGWPAMDESNDYSWTDSIQWQGWDHMTVYINGLAVAGREPLPSYCLD